jgi:hypothetical protein
MFVHNGFYHKMPGGTAGQALWRYQACLFMAVLPAGPRPEPFQKIHVRLKYSLEETEGIPVLHFKRKPLGQAVIVFLLTVAAFSGAGCQPDAVPQEPAQEPREAVIPAESLPFPGDEIAATWEVDGNRILVERVENLDHSFFLYDSDTQETTDIISVFENATYVSRNGESLLFTGRGGDDTGNFDFPYLLRYGLDTGEVQREQLFIPLERPVALGKLSWRQVLRRVEAGPEGVSMEFAPHEGEVLAGGHCRPVTTIRWHEDEGCLVLRFYNVVAELSRVNAASLGDSLQVRDVTGEAVVQDDAGLLGEGFPYGLLIQDPSLLEGIPVAEVRVAVDSGSAYSVSFPHLEPSPDSVIRYLLEVQ